MEVALEIVLTHVMNEVKKKIELAMHDVVIPKVKSEILQQKKMQFDSMGANAWDSTEFPELQRSTIRKKRSKGSSRPEQALFDTGELEGSLYMSGDDDDLDAHYTSGHGAYSEAWMQSKGNPHSFHELTEVEEEKVLDEIVEELHHALS